MNNTQKKPSSSKLSPYHKKKYLQFIKKLGLESTIPKLEKTPFFWELICKKFSKVEVVLGDFNIPPHTYRSITDRFIFYLENIPIVVSPSIPKVTIFEAFFLFNSLRHTISSLFSEETKIYKQFAPLFKHYYTQKTKQMVDVALAKCVSLALFNHSFLEYYLYSCTVEVDTVKRGTVTNPIYIFRIIRTKTKCDTFTIGGKRREAFRLITCGRKMDICVNTICWKGQMYPVYIQAHAVRRIEERIHIPSSQVYQYLSFCTQFNCLREYRDRIIIPITYLGKNFERIGYLIGTIVNEVLLIRTFLFISQDYTPEGDKLTQILELEMIDKGYLNLDKLEHFTKSNLKDDELLRPIFKASRLDHLFDIKETIPANEITENSQFIRDMLQLG